MDVLVKSGGVGVISSSSMQFPCWWWQTEEEFQANLECHLVFLHLACSGKKWESCIWSWCWLKKHLQNDKLSPWFLFWGVCFLQLGICISLDGMTDNSHKPTVVCLHFKDSCCFGVWFLWFFFSLSLNKIVAYKGWGWGAGGCCFYFPLLVGEVLNNRVLLKPSFGYWSWLGKYTSSDYYFVWRPVLSSSHEYSGHLVLTVIYKLLEGVALISVKKKNRNCACRINVSGCQFALCLKNQLNNNALQGCEQEPGTFTPAIFAFGQKSHFIIFILLGKCWCHGFVASVGHGYIEAFKHSKQMKLSVQRRTTYHLVPGEFLLDRQDVLYKCCGKIQMR